MIQAGELATTTVRDIPLSTLDYLKPFAIRNGHRGNRAALVRFAVVELERRLRDETREQQPEVMCGS